MRKPVVCILSALLLTWGAALAQEVDQVGVNTFSVFGGKDFLSGYPARNADGTINVVVEIPTGTNDKWEVSADGALRWEIKDGQPRVVRYLGYPGNYGMIPRTLLASEEGGDGDPLDVILLGPPLRRGTVVPARLLGVLKLLDGGEQDDKLIAVAEDSPLSGATTLAELNARFPGVTRIVETWFTHYKGPGEMESRGYGDDAEALTILIRAESSWARKEAAGE